MENTSILQAIRERRSIREFTAEPVGGDQLRHIIEAGIWAPSGLNNQPWRFVTVVDSGLRRRLAELTHYGHIIQAAAALIVVYLDTEAMYDTVKDHQAAGACIQNMLLATEALDLGAVWLGEILKNKDRVNTLLEVPATFDLMAVLTIGRPAHRNQRSHRTELSSFIFKEL